MKQFRMVRIYKNGVKYGPWLDASKEPVDKWIKNSNMSNKLYRNHWYLEFRQEDINMIKKIDGYYYATDKRGNTEKFASYEEAVEWLEMRG